jgi:hypothetical protein
MKGNFFFVSRNVNMYEYPFPVSYFVKRYLRLDLDPLNVNAFYLKRGCASSELEPGFMKQ